MIVFGVGLAVQSRRQPPRPSEATAYLTDGRIGEQNSKLTPAMDAASSGSFAQGLSCWRREERPACIAERPGADQTEVACADGAAALTQGRPRRDWPGSMRSMIPANKRN